MAHTAHKDAAMMEELFDTPEVLEQKIKQLAEMIRQCKHMVCFTGAGISTSAKIPDYRGPKGVWTLSAQGKSVENTGVNLEDAVPSPCHMALSALASKGILKHIISQNVDGLHRRSGIPSNCISELHGNFCVERCDTCNMEFFRDFPVRTARHHLEHLTGNFCPVANCNGRLRDTIVNFGENLPVGPLTAGFAHADASDLHVVFGSSLTVRPACEMPRATAANKSGNGKLVIVNLQRTPLDSLAFLRIHARTDEVMEGVMRELGIDIPPFVLHRKLVLWRDDAEHCVKLTGLEPSDQSLPASVVRRVTIINGNGEDVAGVADPVTGVFSCPLANPNQDLHLRLSFFGHYAEPDLLVTFAHSKNKMGLDLSLQPGSSNSGWTVVEADNLAVPNIQFSQEKRQYQEESAAVAPGVKSFPDLGGWFAVTPLKTCPHLEAHVDPDCFTHVDIKAPCGTCGNVGENMICLKCGVVQCGRHVNGHMIEHNETTKHSLVCGFVDLSFWCYECEGYICPSNPHLRFPYAVLHTAKFGAPPPGAGLTTA